MMNDRIKQLAEQVYGSAHHDDFKFAELIVAECLAKIENEAAQYAEPVWAFELVNDIKQHFGVE